MAVEGDCLNMYLPQKKGKHWLQQPVRIVYLMARAVVSTCLGLMVFLVVIDVIGRSISGSGLPGTVEINEYLLIIVGFLGIFQTHHEKGHVCVDLLFDKLPPSVRITLDRINNALIFLFSLLLLYAGTARFWSALQAGETNWFGAYVVPVWFVRIVVPIGCFALCMQSLMNIVRPDPLFGDSEANE